jgi:lipopolysaccharide heptosyltransferase III
MALALPAKPCILVITLRRLGDVLMATPLIRTVRRAYPQARIDALVFRGSDRILAGNPDVDNVLTIVEHAPLTEMLVLIGRILRRYDLAITTQTGDRPTLLAWLAGKQRLGFISDAEPGSRWNRALLNHRVMAQPQNHRVEELLRLDGRATGDGFQALRRAASQSHVRLQALERRRLARAERCACRART